MSKDSNAEKEPAFKKIIDEVAHHQGTHDLSKVFKEAYEYFEHLNKVLHEGNEEEKKEAMQQFIEMKKMVDTSMRQMANKTGKSIEEVREILKNPEHYSEEQWQAMNESMDEIRSISTDLPELIGENLPKKKKKKKGSKTTKDKWMKS